jgi:hypothetical protein
VSEPSGLVTYRPYSSESDPLRVQPSQAFVDWWSEAIVSDSAGNVFSRADMLSVASQDGGAHIDDRGTAAYAALTQDNCLGVTVTTNLDFRRTLSTLFGGVGA